MLTEEHRNLKNLTVWSNFVKHRHKKFCEDVCPEDFSKKKIFEQLPKNWEKQMTSLPNQDTVTERSRQR